MSGTLPPGIADALQRHVTQGAVAGVVALTAHGGAVEAVAIGLQDLASATAMRRDSIFRIASMTKPVTAAAAMMLVDDGRIALDDAVQRWLPELADRRVLRGSIESRLDDTVPAARPISLRDLLTFRLGLGAIMAPPGQYPIQAAMAELGVAPGPDQLPFDADEYMARIGRLPLVHQPGERWMYHTGADILAVLIARVAGMALPDFLQQRIFEPLHMADTGFNVPPASIGRLATCYVRDANGSLQVWDPARGGRYAQPPAFPNALVSTADDYAAFAGMLLRRGAAAGLLSADSLRLMLTDHITPAQKAASPFFPGFWDKSGWGFGGAVSSAGGNGPTYGWTGGFGTSFTVEPASFRTAILLLQRLMAGPDDLAINHEFHSLVAEQANHDRETP
jgi:CubicO group peptidase (beta-lactamase class C family)